jgi:plasmid maintenance system antidote protein VapI
MVKNGMRPVHPGEILLEEFMKGSDPPSTPIHSPKHLRCRQTELRQLSRDSEALRAILPCVWQRFSIPRLNFG